MEIGEGDDARKVKKENKTKNSLFPLHPFDGKYTGDNISKKNLRESRQAKKTPLPYFFSF